MTDNWITDRGPTAADADSKGHVSVKCQAAGFTLVNWAYVADGAPWRRTSCWRSTAPAGEGWITDRLPSERNGDEDGDVMVFIGPERHCYVYSHWQQVKQGDAWKPRPHREHTLKEPVLAVGQAWRRRDGSVVTVTRYANSDNTFLAGDWVGPTGRALGSWDAHPHDLVELVELVSSSAQEAEAPTAVERKFVSISRTIQANGSHTLDAIDDDGVAWWMVVGDARCEPVWSPLSPLPTREVPADA